MAAEKQIRILTVDDHPVSREGIAAIPPNYYRRGCPWEGDCIIIDNGLPRGRLQPEGQSSRIINEYHWTLLGL